MHEEIRGSFSQREVLRDVVFHQEPGGQQNGILMFFFEKTVHYTDWLIGIFIMVYYNPYING